MQRIRETNERTLVSYLPLFQAHGSRPALFYKTGFRRFQVTYEELFNFAHRIANYFQQCGLRKGDRVILWGTNSPEWVAAFLGCMIQGLIAVPMDVRGSLSFVEKIFEFTKASLLICDASKKSDLGHIHAMSFEEIKKESALQRIEILPNEKIKPTDIVEILFTSGTTAEPKGVVLTHENIFSNVEALDASTTGLKENEKWLSLLPLSHIFEQTNGLWLPLKRGYSITYLKILKASSIFKTLEEDGITVVPIVPRLLKLMKDGILREVKRQGKEKVFDFVLSCADRVPSKVR